MAIDGNGRITVTLVVISTFIIFLTVVSLFPFHPLVFSVTVNKLTKLSLARPSAIAYEALYHGNNSSSVPNPTVRKVVSEAEKLEFGLARARISIQNAIKINVSSNTSSSSSARKPVVYRNPEAFHQSYLEMENRFKIYVYEDGTRPIVHDGFTKDIYASEGRFIHEMESGYTKFRTQDPHRAHVYFMPFSVTMMVKFLYHPYTFDKTPLKNFVSGYVRVISKRYPFWNRTQGADHFMLSCHDWAPEASFGDIALYRNSIRVLCNANTSEGFDPRKDVTLPEINFHDGYIPKDLVSVPSNSTRQHLGFFSGGSHGPVRPLLFQHWLNRDPDILVYEYLPKNLSYNTFMLHSKYCLCPSGFEVASPRVVEAIFAECIPVIISENYVLPFSDVLRWEAFSIQVKKSDIPYLKERLMRIPEQEYIMLKEGVRAVKKHFMLNKPPKRFDVFHMILHSVWLRRLNIQLL